MYQQDQNWSSYLRGTSGHLSVQSCYISDVANPWAVKNKTESSRSYVRVRAITPSVRESRTRSSSSPLEPISSKTYILSSSEKPA